MAILIPNLEAAKAAKQKPTEGEVFLLEFLATHFDDQVEVYFQPCFNGDRPDIVLMSPTMGVIIIEVKDWNLDLYTIDSDNKWAVSLPTGSQRVKSPFQQAYSYKKNFFEVHVNGLLEKSLKNEKFFRLIRTYVYFHHGSKTALDRLYQPHLDRLHEQSRENEQRLKANPDFFDSYEKKREWIERGKHRFERDLSLSIHKDRLKKIAFPIAAKDMLFEESVYNEFKRLLNPPFHYASEGKPPTYSDKQAKLIVSSAKARA
ncbi:MAG: hypothetical protein DI539_30535, partial [Flavobacterium psychrophilum]